MKPQDSIFFLILLLLFWKQKPRFFIFAGIISIIVAMPLFYLWVFFTAQRLIWYAVAFFTVAVFLQILLLRKQK